MSMYFVQHGRCVAREVDPDRPLSDKGRKKTERIAIRLRDAGVAVKQVCHSGKTRARQTAELFGLHIGLGRITAVDGMLPNDDPEELMSVLEDDTLYVGHLPHLERLVSLLVAGRKEAEVIHFENSGVVCIGRTDSGFEIEWYVIPSLYRA